MAKPRLEPTPEFYRFGLGFYQDLDRTGKTEDEVWAIVLDPFTGQDRIRLRDFLDRITQDAVPDADLLRLGTRRRPIIGGPERPAHHVEAGSRPAAAAAEPAVLARARPVGPAQTVTPHPVAFTMYCSLRSNANHEPYLAGPGPSARCFARARSECWSSVVETSRV